MFEHRVWAAGVVFLIACTSQADDAPRELPLIRIEALDLSFTVPAELPAGLTRIRLVNLGAVWHEALVTRLPDGVTTEAYLAAARAGDEFPVNAVDVGGPGLVATNDSSEVVVDLEPGRYAIVCWSDNHVKSGRIAPMAVTVGDRNAVEFFGRDVRGFGSHRPRRRAHSNGRGASRGLSLRARLWRVSSGALNVLRVRNTGQRPHEMTGLQARARTHGTRLRDVVRGQAGCAARDSSWRDDNPRTSARRVADARSADGELPRCVWDARTDTQWRSNTRTDGHGGGV